MLRQLGTIGIMIALSCSTVGCNQPATEPATNATPTAAPSKNAGDTVDSGSSTKQEAPPAGSATK